MRPSCNHSEHPQSPGQLRPKQRRALQGRICRRVEGGVFRSGRRREGYQAVFKRRIAEGPRCGLLMVLYSYPLLADNVCIEILQGGRGVEIPSTSKHSTTHRSSHVGNSV